MRCPIMLVMALLCSCVASGVFADGKIDAQVNDVIAQQVKRFEEAKGRADKMRATKADRQLLTPNAKRAATRTELMKAADAAIDQLAKGEWAGPGPMIGLKLSAGSVGHLVAGDWTTPYLVTVTKVLKNDRFVAQLWRGERAYVAPPKSIPSDLVGWNEVPGYFVFEGFGLSLADGEHLWLYEPVVVVGEPIDVGSFKCRWIRPLKAFVAKESKEK